MWLSKNRPSTSYPTLVVVVFSGVPCNPWAKFFSQVDSSVVDTNDETFLKGEYTCELVDGQTYMKPSFDSLSVVDRLTICCSTAPPAAWLLCWKTSPAGLKEKVTAPSRTFFYHQLQVWKNSNWRPGRYGAFQSKKTAMYGAQKIFLDW